MQFHEHQCKYVSVKKLYQAYFARSPSNIHEYIMQLNNERI